jgi:hypothetical protein
MANFHWVRIFSQPFAVRARLFATSRDKGLSGGVASCPF